jgi:hypothetical protein
MAPVRSGEIMTSYVSARATRIWKCLCCSVPLGLITVACIPHALAKEPSLSAIELYDGASGAAYVQINDVLINGKVELRSCTLGQQIDKSSYGKLPKVSISQGSTLERNKDGVLLLTTANIPPLCVVPSNIKVEKNAAFTPSELADHALLKGTLLTLSPDTGADPPLLKRGVKLIFTPVPNLDLAEYLRAERANSQHGWQSYLARYPAGQHAPAAKVALVALYFEDGTRSLGAYRASSASDSPAYSELKNSKLRADLACALISDSGPAMQLRDEVRKELGAISDSGRAELELFKQALIARSAGYVHLVTARKLSAAVLDIDSQSPPGLALQSDASRENAAIEAALHSADQLQASKQFDKALTQVAPYRSFFDEEPRVAAIVKAAYAFHLEKGTGFAGSQDWQDAVAELEKAKAILATPEAAAALDRAQAELINVQNKSAAFAALAKSKGLTEEHNYIAAYETLAGLPPAQRVLVADDLQQLVPFYIQAASQEAKNLQQAHVPIRGLDDEKGVQRAYADLQRAYQLGNDPALKDRLDSLANDLSEYYLQQGKHYLSKPAGSGTELGWTYLREAMGYKPLNIDAVRDAITEASPAHNMRSRLSIRVQFRDQTSQRDSPGFAAQLENAVITGLEASGLPVRVVRSGDSTSVEPDFQLIGDVLDHHSSLIPTVDSLESKFRAAEHESPNEEWNKANRQYESAILELQTAQSVLQGAQPHGKRKEIAEATHRVEEAKKNVEVAHAKLDSISKTITTDVIRSYTYQRKTFSLHGVVKLQFRIGESLSGLMDNAVPITKEADEEDVVLDDVKPEDTEGVKAKGTIPDKVEYLAKMENEARDELIAQIRKKVADLPRKVFEEAGKKAQDGDIDGAAEAYILYLNSTSLSQTTERGRAEQFLQEQFNMRLAENSPP